MLIILHIIYHKTHYHHDNLYNITTWMLMLGTARRLSSPRPPTSRSAAAFRYILQYHINYYNIRNVSTIVIQYSVIHVYIYIYMIYIYNAIYNIIAAAASTRPPAGSRPGPCCWDYLFMFLFFLLSKRLAYILRVWGHSPQWVNSRQLRHGSSLCFVQLLLICSYVVLCLV